MVTITFDPVSLLVGMFLGFIITLIAHIWVDDGI